jgi:hypothetical protein
MSHLQGELAKARAELAAARVVMAVAHPAAVIHAIDYEDDDDMGFLPNDEDVSVVREPLEAAVVCRLWWRRHAAIHAKDSFAEEQTTMYDR